MTDVDQRGMPATGSLDIGPGRLRTTGVQGNGDDLEALRVQLLAQFLPHGQVVATASPRRPGDEQDLLAVQGGQAEGVVVEVG